MSAEFDITETLDVKGASCPMPVVKTKSAIDDLSEGEVLEVLATDPGSARDFQSLQRLAGHQVVTHQRDDGVLQHWITKA